MSLCYLLELKCLISKIYTQWWIQNECNVNTSVNTYLTHNNDLTYIYQKLYSMLNIAKI